MDHQHGLPLISLGACIQQVQPPADYGDALLPAGPDTPDAGSGTAGPPPGIQNQAARGLVPPGDALQAVRHGGEHKLPAAGGPLGPLIAPLGQGGGQQPQQRYAPGHAHQCPPGQPDRVLLIVEGGQQQGNPTGGPGHQACPIRQGPGQDSGQQGQGDNRRRQIQRLLAPHCLKNGSHIVPPKDSANSQSRQKKQNPCTD